MIKYIQLIILLMILGTLQGQEYKVPFNNGTIVIANMDDVIIEGYTGSDIIISTDDYDHGDDPDRAAGLKLVNSLGLEDNTGIGLSVEKSDGKLVISAISNNCGESLYKLQIPKNLNVEYSHRANSGERFYAKNVEGEIVVSTNYCDVKLEDVTGPLSIKSVYGFVDAHFSKVSQVNAISLYSVYDFVDVSIPSDSKISVDVKTPYGGIYTDVEIAINSDHKGDYNSINSKSLYGDVNGGGVSMNVKSGYENVYLRKNK